MKPGTSLAPSVPEAIEEILRERILAGRLEPDEPLREAALAEEFSVSRHTIREALLRLDHAGLVYRRSHRGSRVTRADRQHLREVMALRRVVEPGAARRVDPADPELVELRRLADEMEVVTAAGDWGRYGELDRAFHTGLVARGGSARVTELFAGAIEELRLHFHALDPVLPPGPRHDVTEHRRIVDALAAGHRREALALLDGHLDRAEAWLLEGARTPKGRV